MMASYNYGPPPPAPVVASASGTQGAYGYAQPYQQPQQRGGHAGRGGRGGATYAGGRPEYHAAAPAYAYGVQQQPQPTYAQPAPAAYGPQQPPQQSYAPPPHHHQQHQQHQQQQWQHDHSQAHQQPHPHAPHHQQSAQPTASLPAQNYHPNYAPQHYQRQSSYGQPPPPSLQHQPQQQQPYAPPQQPAYAQPYPAHAPTQASPTQPWPAAAPMQAPRHSAGGGGGGRGRGGYNSDRGGSRAQSMGPPIRMGFDPLSQYGQPAPVSNGYQQPYAAPQPAATVYPTAPYPAAYSPSQPLQPQYPPAPYESANSHGRGFPQRGGSHHGNRDKFKQRPPYGNEKPHHRKHSGPSHTPVVAHQKPDAASAGKKKKRRTNTLGLTPDDADDSAEEYDNEEEVLKELIGDDAPNPTDIAAWIAERRRNFPSKARADARRNGQSKDSHGKKELSERDAELERQQQKAEKLRKQLENLETSIKRKREQQDEGDEMRAVDASPVSSSDSKSDDEKPETLSTREQMVIPPAAKKADQTKHCKYFSTGGVCGKKGKCRFVHDLEVRTAALQERERNGGRMTLQQRLILNDKEQEDLTIVKTLAYLQGKGMISGSTKSNTETDSETTAQSQPEQSGQAAPRTLPPAPVKREQINHSLPAIPPAPISQGNASAGKRYEGWNLSGFGNTGVKAGDI